MHRSGSKRSFHGARIDLLRARALCCGRQRPYQRRQKTGGTDAQSPQYRTGPRAQAGHALSGIAAASHRLDPPRRGSGGTRRTRLRGALGARVRAGTAEPAGSSDRVERRRRCPRSGPQAHLSGSRERDRVRGKPRLVLGRERTAGAAAAAEVLRRNPQERGPGGKLAARPQIRRGLRVPAGSGRGGRARILPRQRSPGLDGRQHPVASR